MSKIALLNQETIDKNMKRMPCYWGEKGMYSRRKGGFMRKIRLGLYLEDQEYGERFTSCLMKHYQDRLELHLFTEEQAAVHACAGLDGMLLSGWREAYENMHVPPPVPL